MIWDSITGNCCQILQAHFKSGISRMSHSIDNSMSIKASGIIPVIPKSWLVTSMTDGSLKIWKKSAFTI
jgi:hypothetical protein